MRNLTLKALLTTLLLLMVTMTAIIGAVSIRGETTLKPAFKRADQGLYAAKELGRNRVEWENA